MKINLGMSKLGIMLECPMLLRSLLLVFSMNSFALTLDDPNDLRGVTDQVMGGKSVLSIDHEDGIFYMKGTVTTANNGGFVRLSKRIDIKDNSYKGVTFKAKAISSNMNSMSP